MRQGGDLMSRSRSTVSFCRNTPSSIRELLKLLADVDEDVEVKLILKSGEKECVTVQAVSGNLLVATIYEEDVKFIDIDCICAVIVDCKDVLESLFRSKRC